MFDKTKEMDDKLLKLEETIRQKLMDGHIDENERSKLCDQLKIIYECRKMNADIYSTVTEAKAKAKTADAEAEKLRKDAENVGKIDVNELVKDAGLIGAILLIMHYEELSVIATKAFSLIPHILRRA